MKQLLAIEYLKIKHHTVFRAFILLYMVLVPLVFYLFSLIDFPFFKTGSALYRFPAVWDYLPYVASWFTVFPGILVAALVCNEVSYKTQKQNVIDGLSRLEVILSKFYVVMALTIIATVYIFVVASIFGIFSSGVSNLFVGIEQILFLFIQTLASLSMAMLLAVIIRKSALSILAYLVLFLFAGLTASQTMPAELAQWMPLNIMNNLVENPWLADLDRIERMANPTAAVAANDGLSEWINAAGTAIYTVAFVALSYVVMKNRDL